MLFIVNLREKDLMLEVLKHGLIDSLKALPVLFIVYILLELLEYKGVMGFEKSKMLKGKASPVFGAVFGCVPQCGFSIVSTDLYSKKKLSIGALIAVFIATSDEAVPMMIADVDAIPELLLLIAIKVVLGIGIGYLAMWLYSKIFTQSGNLEINEEDSEDGVNDVESEHMHNENEHSHNQEALEERHTHKEEHKIGCCHHNIEDEKFEWKHPILHSLKIFSFILVVNIIFGAVVHFVGEDSLLAFLNMSSPFQPLLAVLVGLIPNCASSVVITELYLIGGLSFGALLAGLSVNAGLGLVVLFKQNKNIKENLFIIAMLIVPSLLVGYGLHFIF